MRIGIVAGETSGDFLGAGLMTALRRRYPDIRFEGVGGERMTQAGLSSMFPMSSISVMGVDDLIHRIVPILRIRRRLVEHFRCDPPRLFIGVDVPDFNLGIERRLKRAGIDTVHYVSPTVWAWRGYRIHKIRAAVSHMLTMFPFEADFYRRHGVPVSFVGHPIADEIDERPDRHRARRELGLSAGRVVALLPGSRDSEVRRLGPPFVDAAARLCQAHTDLQLVVPAANPAVRRLFENSLANAPRSLPLVLTDGRARDALAAADVALLASGTAALEAALLGTPMVVAYRVSWMTAVMVRLFAHVKYFSMPNNLLARPIVPELLQDEANGQALFAAVQRFLLDPGLCRETEQAFAGILTTLRRNASERAADAVAGLIEARAS